MGRKEVTSEFKDKLAAVHGNRILLVGKYIASGIATEFKCKCGNVFSYTPNNALRFCKKGCPKCVCLSRITNNKSTQSDYAAKILHIYGGTLNVAGIYENAKAWLDHECGKCEFVFKAKPNKVLTGFVTCPKCKHLEDPSNIAHLISMGHSLKGAATIAYPTLEFYSVGKTVFDKAKFKCKVCTSHQTRNLLTLKRSPCLACGKAAKSKNLRHSHDDYVGRIRKIWGNKVQVVGSYISTKRKVRHKCLVCFNTWKVSPLNSLHRNSGCPFCAGVIRRKNLSLACKPKEHLLGDKTVFVQGYEPQALKYMVEIAGIPAEDIEVESEGNVPIVDYRLRKRRKRYFPDMFIPNTNTIVEVKSTYTLGLGITRRHKKYWRANCAKAIACHNAGFKFALLLMDTKGRRIPLPKGWAYMTCAEVMTAINSLEEK